MATSKQAPAKQAAAGTTDTKQPTTTPTTSRSAAAPATAGGQNDTSDGPSATGEQEPGERIADGFPLSDRLLDEGTTVVAFVGGPLTIGRQVTELLDGLAAELENASGRRLVIVDSDREPMAVLHHQIKVVPSMLVFVDGRLRARRTGAVSAASLQSLAGLSGR